MGGGGACDGVKDMSALRFGSYNGCRCSSLGSSLTCVTNESASCVRRVCSESYRSNLVLGDLATELLVVDAVSGQVTELAQCTFHSVRDCFFLDLAQIY